MLLPGVRASLWLMDNRAMPPRYAVSDHCDGQRFFNPAPASDRSIREVITWQRTRVKTPWPESVPLTPHVPPPTIVPPGRVAATFIGHSTFLLRTSTAVILTDPVFTTHAGPFGRIGPRRVRPPAIALEHIPMPDIVLVSHNHYDHLQPSSLRRCAQGAEPMFIVPLGLKAFVSRQTLANVIELDWWEETAVNEDIGVTCVPAQHFSARTPWDRNRTLWCGFVVQSAGARIDSAGDTGYSSHFYRIGQRFPRLSLALLPIGADEPRWFMQPVHMNPAEAVQAHRDLGACHSIGTHFGTFQLTDEGIDDPLDALDRALAESGESDEEFTVLDFGESAIV